jgi:L-asparaginase
MKNIFRKSLFLVIFATGVISPMQSFAKQNIVILATGGTIAGVGESSHGSKYASGKVTVEQMIEANPSLKELANLKGEQVFQMGSENMNDDSWLTIARKVNDLVNDSDVDGIVITHGTDTLEETAYFLNLTIHTKKPIILVGAMRPSSSVSADGPLNLYNAVAVAANKDARNKGVLVVFNDKIFAARDVTKNHTTNVAAFTAPNTGPIGNSYYGNVIFYHDVLRKHTNNSMFNIKNIKSLPKVEIVYGYTNQDAGMIDYLVSSETKGIICAGVGDGNIYKSVLEKLIKVKKENDLAIVRSSRVGGGFVVPNVEINDNENGFVVSDNLSPQKARILLKLALTKTNNPKALQEIFLSY